MFTKIKNQSRGFVRAIFGLMIVFIILVGFIILKTNIFSPVSQLASVQQAHQLTSEYSGKCANYTALNSGKNGFCQFAYITIIPYGSRIIDNNSLVTLKLKQTGVLTNRVITDTSITLGNLGLFGGISKISDIENTLRENSSARQIVNEMFFAINTVIINNPTLSQSINQFSSGPGFSPAPFIPAPSIPTPQVKPRPLVPVPQTKPNVPGGLSSTLPSTSTIPTDISTVPTTTTTTKVGCGNESACNYEPNTQGGVCNYRVIYEDIHPTLDKGLPSDTGINRWLEIGFETYSLDANGDQISPPSKKIWVLNEPVSNFYDRIFGLEVPEACTLKGSDLVQLVSARKKLNKLREELRQAVIKK